MPIGVPKVPFQSPQEDDQCWVDIKCNLSYILGHMGFLHSLSLIEISSLLPKKDQLNHKNFGLWKWEIIYALTFKKANAI